MQLTRIALADLAVDTKNARQHGKRNLEAISGSLAAFGQVENLVVQKGSLKVIGGNGRVAAMRAAGHTHADVALLDLSDRQAAKLGLALNRTAELAEWNAESLEAMVSDLQAGGVDLSDIGLDDSELAVLAGPPDLGELDGDGPADKPAAKPKVCPNCGHGL